MSTKLYVGNLPFSLKDEDLGELFSAVGTVVNARVMQDRNRNRSRGFAFVDMETRADAEKVIEQFDDKEVEGRTLSISLARPYLSDD